MSTLRKTYQNTSFSDTRIVDSVLIREGTVQRKPLYWHILRNAILP